MFTRCRSTVDVPVTFALRYLIYDSTIPVTLFYVPTFWIYIRVVVLLLTSFLRTHTTTLLRYIFVCLHMLRFTFDLLRLRYVADLRLFYVCITVTRYTTFVLARSPVFIYPFPHVTIVGRWVDVPYIHAHTFAVTFADVTFSTGLPPTLRY